MSASDSTDSADSSGAAPLSADLVAAAVAALSRADALLVTAGAGIGVDSGLPDFRGTDGFWRAYPALRHERFEFHEIASPQAFRAWPQLAWGFYGHRLALYRSTVPHAGFAILRRWLDAMPNGGFVLTSNVDGQFQKAGFDPARIVEIRSVCGRARTTHGTPRLSSRPSTKPHAGSSASRRAARIAAASHGRTS